MYRVCIKQQKVKIRDDLTSAESTVSFKSSKTATNVEALNVGTQSVGVAFV